MSTLTNEQLEQWLASPDDKLPYAAYDLAAELLAARKYGEQSHKDFCEAHDKLLLANAHIAELESDRNRMDWLEAHLSHPFKVLQNRLERNLTKTLREEIDATRKETV